MVSRFKGSSIMVSPVQSLSHWSLLYLAVCTEEVHIDTGSPSYRLHWASKGRNHCRKDSWRHRAPKSAAGPEHGRTHELPPGGDQSLQKDKDYLVISFTHIVNSPKSSYQHYSRQSNVHHSRSGLRPLWECGERKHGPVFLQDRRTVSHHHASTCKTMSDFYLMTSLKHVKPMLGHPFFEVPHLSHFKAKITTSPLEQFSWDKQVEFWPKAKHLTSTEKHKIGGMRIHFFFFFFCSNRTSAPCSKVLYKVLWSLEPVPDWVLNRNTADLQQHI